MKAAYFISLATATVLSSTVIASTATAPLTLQPGSLLEDLHTGIVTLKDETLKTELGATISLKLTKTIDYEYSGSRHNYEVIGTDEVHFCNDGTEANYLEIIDNESSITLQAYQEKTNPKTNTNYVSRCGSYFYLHPAE